MPYPVENLLEGCGNPVVVKKNDPVNDALSLMIENDFSQLPVVNEENQPLGMITYEAIVKGLVNFNAQVDEILVGSVMVDAQVFSCEDDLFDLLNRLRDTNAVLISDSGGELVGIVTSYDSTEYFRKRAEDLMDIEDIESTIKELILDSFTLNEKFPLERDEIDQEGLQAAIDAIIITADDVRRRYSAALSVYVNKTSGNSDRNHIAPEAFEESFKKLQNDPKPKGFEELNLSEYIALLLDKSRWQYFQPIFGLSQEKVRNLLNEIRKSRNILMHFHGELSPQQRDQLKFCAAWLNRAQTDFEEQAKAKLVEKLIESHKEPEEEIIPDITLVPEDFDRKTSKYAPLASWLQSHPGSVDRVSLSFEEIEQVIEAELPQSAYQHKAWWANDTVGHVQSKNWLDAGWRVSSRNISAKTVTFVRIVERERAYIDFFGSLLSHLQEKTNLPLKDFSPDGVSWIVLIRLPKTGSEKSWINFSFALNNRFRIELYIDTGDKIANKNIFDALYSHQSEIEKEVGTALSWERLDSKRASRIALYHPGNISGPKEELEKMIIWTVESLPLFYDAIYERANAAIEEQISE